jgi:hypothetical protein
MLGPHLKQLMADPDPRIAWAAKLQATIFMAWHKAGVGLYADLSNPANWPDIYKRWIAVAMERFYFRQKAGLLGRKPRRFSRISPPG